MSSKYNVVLICLTPCSPWWPSRRVQIMQLPCLIRFEARKLCFSCQMLLPNEEGINVKFSTWHMWSGISIKIQILMLQVMTNLAETYQISIWFTIYKITQAYL